MDRSRKLSLLWKGGVAALAGGALLLAVLFSLYNTPAGEGKRTLDYEVRRGVGSYTVARELQKEGFLDSPRFFRLYLRLTGQGDEIKVGFYELKDSMTPLEIIRILTEGRVRMVGVTIPEGWNNRQIASLLVEKGYARNEEEFLRLTHDPAILRKYSIPAESTEGYLFPDTYMIPLRFPLEKIHEAMLRRFFQALEEAGLPREQPKELHRKIILASIIEREAARPEELPVMASVFQNRLDKHMRLESCATIQYLLPKPRAKLYDKDLQIKSPYNTYKKTGLPPGPISSPGITAIRSVFHPEKNDFLYFVLKPDGSHHFSSKYSEHLRAKKRYLD